MKKLKFEKEHFNPISRTYKPFDELVAAQRAQKAYDSWYEEYNTKVQNQISELKEQLKLSEEKNEELTEKLPFWHKMKKLVK
jgi:hypothetical protein